MDRKLQSLDINCSADEIAEYMSAGLTSGPAHTDQPLNNERRISHGGRERSIYLALVYATTFRDALIAEVFLRHVRPAKFELVKRAKFHVLVWNPKETMRKFVVRIQRHALKL